MEPRLDFLTATPVARIADAFDAAFADYQVRSIVRSITWLPHRMAKNAVDLDVSVGAFAGDALAGFSLTGIDAWEGEPAAFDAATGILPDYRGQGLAGRMFDFALPRLRDRGVKRFLLEVLQENERAIAAYRKVGFTITREFDCFTMDIDDAVRRAAAPRDTRVATEVAKTPAHTAAEAARGGDAPSIRPVSKERLRELAGEFDWTPSWENSLASVCRAPGEVPAYGAFRDDLLLGMIVHDPVLRWVLSLVVRRDARRAGIGAALVRHLLAHLPPGTERLRIVNVPRADRGMIAFLEGCGFTAFVPQYEMELRL